MKTRVIFILAIVQCVLAMSQADDIAEAKDGSLKVAAEDLKQVNRESRHYHGYWDHGHRDGYWGDGYGYGWNHGHGHGHWRRSAIEQQEPMKRGLTVRSVEEEDNQREERGSHGGHEHGHAGHGHSHGGNDHGHGGHGHGHWRRSVSDQQSEEMKRGLTVRSVQLEREERGSHGGHGHDHGHNHGHVHDHGHNQGHGYDHGHNHGHGHGHGY